MLNSLLGAKDALQFLIWLLVGELLDTTLKSIDLILRTLTNGSLSFAVFGGVSKGALGYICLIRCDGKNGASLKIERDRQ